MLSRLKNIYSYEISITTIWIIAIILVNPTGDFPLNDDWSYTLNAQALALKNKIQFDDWGAMTLIAHTFWGAFFCKIFGFSFTVLRISTLVAAWIGLLGSFHLFQEGGIPKKSAFGLTLLLMFNPWFFSLSFTYMTDVPFLTCLVLSTYFFLKAINKNESKFIILGTLFSVIAALIRQPGVIISLAFFFVFIIKNKTSLKTVIQSVTPPLVSFSTLFLFIQWRKNNHGLSVHFGETSDFIQNLLSDRFLFLVTERLSEFFVHWGISLFPLLIILLGYFLKKEQWQLKFLAIFPTLFLVYFYWGKWKKDLIGNVFYNLGLGPKTLPDFKHGYVPPSEGLISIYDWENVEYFSFLAGVFILLFFWFRAFEFFNFLYQKKKDKINWSVIFPLQLALDIYFFSLAILFCSIGIILRFYLLSFLLFFLKNLFSFLIG